MNGKIVAGGIVLIGLVAGIAMYWLQVYAFYEPVGFTPGDEITLVPIDSDVPEAIVAENITGIDATSSPLRFRACFTTPLTQATLTETYRLYPRPDAADRAGLVRLLRRRRHRRGAGAGRGAGLPVAAARWRRGVDRVVAVFPDGRAYAWHQLNDTLKE